MAENSVNVEKIKFWMLNGWNVLIEGLQGCGKCLGKGTPVLMSDGSIKNVEDVKKGDYLMGPDSKPRKVLSTCRGQEKLYEVIPTKGDKYIVNESHILSLKSCSDFNKDIKKNDVVNISVRDWLNKNDYFKSRMLGWRTPISYEHKEVDLDPYMLGLWLGDGSSATTRITTQDKTIVSFMEVFAKNNNLVLNNIKDDNAGNASTYSLVVNSDKFKNNNIFRNQLKELELFNNKHIPNIYKANSYEVRMQLLAGLLDSDGHKYENCYEISTKYDKLSDDILYLCRSLGFAAYKKESYKSCTNGKDKSKKKYYRIVISGNTNNIPVKIEYKKCSERMQKKDVLKTGIKLNDIGVGDYYGFEIDGDKLFVLGDFTVTHNTTMIKDACKELGYEIGDEALYFSGATLDPYVDFCGIPQKVEDEHGNVILDFIYPKWIAEDRVKVIIIDEYNRAHKKVRNATMELIQFGSINGRKLKNLKCVVTAINPANSSADFDVEELDPAQADRFWIQVEAPYKPNAEYFTREFGKGNAEAAISWWNNLSDELKMKISPRRLDIAVRVFQGRGDLRDVLPADSNISKLKKSLHMIPAIAQLRTMVSNKDFDKLRDWFRVPENYFDVKKEIVSNPMEYDLYIPYLPDEYLSELVYNETNVRGYVLRTEHKNEKFKTILNDIIKSNSNKKTIDEINIYRNNCEVTEYVLNLEAEQGGVNIESFVTVQGFDVFKEKLTNYNKKQTRKEILTAMPKKVSNKLEPDQADKCISVLESALTLWGKTVFLEHAEELVPTMNTLYLAALGDKVEINKLANKYPNIFNLFLTQDGFCVEEGEVKEKEGSEETLSHATA